MTEEYGDDNASMERYWQCQECGYTSYTRPMPQDRTAFYRRVDEQGSPKCPKCKSDSFMPVGF